MESAAGNVATGSRKSRSGIGPKSKTRGRAGSHVAATAPAYDRMRDLPGLIALWPWEIADDTLEGQQKIVDLLQRALRLERKRGIGRDWTYDVARHARLLTAYRNEAARLDARLRAAAGKPQVRMNGEAAQLGDLEKRRSAQRTLWGWRQRRPQRP